MSHVESVSEAYKLCRLAPHLRTRFLTLCVATGLIAAPSTAIAAPPAEFGYGAGVFVGYRFGAVAAIEASPKRRGSLIYGAELYGSYRPALAGSEILPLCYRSEYGGGYGGFGPIFRVTRVHKERTDLSLSLAAGYVASDLLSASGELGVSYAPAQSNPFALVTGARLDGIYLQAFARGLWNLYLKTRIDVGLGVITGPHFYERPVPPSLTCSEEVEGRRWRHEAMIAETCSSWSDDTESSSTPMLAEHWAQAAQAELESVPAFLQLACDLVAAQAPELLVEAALAAAEDEVLHASLCTELARRFGMRGFAPALARNGLRPSLPGRDGLERLVRESWIDGCLEEGRAATQAKWAAYLSEDPQVRAIENQIANDELRHAELAWSILKWAGESGAGERKMLQDLCAKTRMTMCFMGAPRPPDDVEAQRELVDGGCLPARTKMRLRAKVHQTATTRLGALIG
jgi:hypothetical protein